MPDLGNFTIAPRLSEFPSQQLSGGVLFPVQSPYSEKWGVATLAGIAQYVSSLIDIPSGIGRDDIIRLLSAQLTPLDPLHPEDSLIDPSWLPDSHTHSNKSVLDGITAAKVSSWDAVASIMGSDSDTVINKWNEVVAFLDTYTEADTLANLLSNKLDKQFFANIFTVYDSGGNAIVPNTYTQVADNLRILVGTWTEEYLSALGKNPSGGGTGGGDVSYIKVDSTSSGILSPDENGIVDITSYVVSSSDKANWNAAYSARHTHSNKSVLDGITSAKVTAWDAVAKIMDDDADAIINKWDEIIAFLSGIADTSTLAGLLAESAFLISASKKLTKTINGTTTDIVTAATLFSDGLPTNTTKSYVLAAPSNAAGTPTFRALVGADIPDLSGTYATASRATTLEGYFNTGGVAKVAAKLNTGTTTYSAWGQTYWSSGVPTSISGNMTSVGSITPSANGNALGTTSARFNIYGTAGNFSSNVSITGTLGVTGAATLSSSLSVAGGITLTTTKKIYFGDTSHYIELDSTGFHFSHGIYSDSFMSALGSNSSGGGSGTGIDLDAMWASLMNTTTDNYANSKIAVSHIPDTASTYGYLKSSALSGYATQSWVNSQGFLTSHQTIYALTLKAGGTSVTTYTPNSAAASLNFVAGSNISLTRGTDQITIANTYSYTLPVAASGTLGGIKVGYTNTGKNYKVQLDSSNNAYVNVPWADTTYSAGTGISLSGTTFSNSGVRAVSVNGNYLRVNTNGTNADLTIPYASNSNSSNWIESSNGFRTSIGLGYAQTASGPFNGSNTTGAPDGWAHYIMMSHGNGATYYHYQLAFPFLGGPMYQRKIGGSSESENQSDWYSFITSENIASQSVAHAKRVDDYDDGFGGAFFPARGYVGGTGAVVFVYGYNPILFYTNYSEKMRITGSGYVGIGNTSPSEKLHVTGNILASGEITASSDERLKTIVGDGNLDIRYIANAPNILFKWNNGQDDKVHGGSLAQYFLTGAKHFVSGSDKDYYSLNYGALATSMAISIAKEVIKHEDEITRLKKEVVKLRERVAELEERSVA